MRGAGLPRPPRVRREETGLRLRLPEVALLNSEAHPPGAAVPCTGWAGCTEPRPQLQLQLLPAPRPLRARLVSSPAPPLLAPPLRTLPRPLRGRSGSSCSYPDRPAPGCLLAPPLPASPRPSLSAPPSCDRHAPYWPCPLALCPAPSPQALFFSSRLLIGGACSAPRPPAWLPSNAPTRPAQPSAVSQPCLWPCLHYAVPPPN